MTESEERHLLAAVASVAALVLVQYVLALGRWRLALALQLALAGLWVPAQKAMHQEHMTPDFLYSAPVG
jgi:hypothetical protein